MSWTPERKRQAALQGALRRPYTREDTQIIERPGWYQVVTPSATTYMNEISLSHVDDADAERVIDETISFYRAHGLRFKWYVDPSSRPHDLGERLRRRGFESWELRAMGIDTAAAFSVPADVEVVEMDASNIDAFVEITMNAWSLPAHEIELDQRSHHAALARDPRLTHFFAARIDGTWLGTAALMVRDGYGYLLGAQVTEAMRGRGIYRALVAARLAFLRSRGLDYAVTRAQETTSAPILEHLGFETLFRSTGWRLSER